MSARSHPRKLMPAAAILLFTLGCTDLDQNTAGVASMTGGGRASLSPELAQNPAIGTPRALPELVADLPPTARAHDTSDVALAAALVSTRGFAAIGLRAPGSARMASSARLEQDLIAPPGRIARRGRRSAMSAQQVSAGLNAIANSGVEVLAYYANLGTAGVRVAPGTSLAALRQNPFVDYIEPAQSSDVLAAESAPMGPVAPRALSRARHLDAEAFFTQTVPSNIEMVRASEAWPYSTGSTARLLIIDSGIDRGHEDLPFIPLANCMGGYPGCVDNVGHGTMVLGVAAASDNAVGVVGLAKGLTAANVFSWGVCLDANNCWKDSTVKALNWAAANLGAQGVINLSLASPDFYQPYANAIASAINAGHVIVAAGGNSAANTFYYPAGYSSVIGVAGVRPDSTFAVPSPCSGTGGSSWGDHIDLVAPYQVTTTAVGNDYSVVCGTSFASPAVAGVAALVRTAQPTINGFSVFQRIRDTAHPLGPVGWDDHFGYGLPRSHLAATWKPPAPLFGHATKVGGSHPRVSWNPIPFATEYRVYRRVTPSLCPNWTFYASTTASPWVDQFTNIPSDGSGIYGYNIQPPTQTAVSYAITAVQSGVETPITNYFTFIPTAPVYC
jgi:subtilisin family serine protease